MLLGPQFVQAMNQAHNQDINMSNSNGGSRSTLQKPYGLELTIENKQYTASLDTALKHIMNYRLGTDRQHNPQIIGLHQYNATNAQPYMSGIVSKINQRLWIFTYGNPADFHIGYVIYNGKYYINQKTFFPCGWDKDRTAQYLVQLLKQEYIITQAKKSNNKQAYALFFKSKDPLQADLRLIAEIKSHAQSIVSIPTLYPIINKALITTPENVIKQTLDTLARQQSLALQNQSIKNEKKPELCSELIQALKDKNNEYVTKLLTVCTNVNECDTQKKTPLMIAAQTGNADAVTLLLECGADASLVDISGKSALWYAIQSYDYYTLLSLMYTQNQFINQPDKAGITPLIYAISNIPLDTDINRYLEVIDFLLTSGAHAHQADIHGLTPLLHAIRLSFSDIKYQPLTVALLSLLISCGADIDAQDIHGYTCLMRAVEYNLKEVVELLLRLHADCAIINRGQTAAQMAHNQRLYVLEQLIQQALHEKETWLAANGAHELMYALYTNNVTKVRTLLAKHPEMIDFKDAEGATALYAALASGNDTIIKYLLDAGANPCVEVYGQSIGAYAQSKEDLSAETKALIKRAYDAITMPLLEAERIQKEIKQQQLRAIADQFKRDLSLGLLSEHTLQAIEPIKNICFLQAVTQKSVAVVKQLLDRKINILCTNAQKQDALDLAYAGNDMHMLDLLILSKLVPEDRIRALWATAVDKKAYTVIDSLSNLKSHLRLASLIAYSKEQNLDKIKFLLNNQRIALSQTDANNLLYVAIEYSSTDIVTYLLNLYPQALEHTNTLGQTALMVAALHDKLEIITLLCAQHAKLEVLDKQIKTILECQSLPKKSRELLLSFLKQQKQQEQLFLQQETRKQETDKLVAAGWTPLMIAAYFDDLQAIQHDTSDPAAVTPQESYTALMIAAQHNSNTVFDMLLEKSVSVLNAQDTQGYTVLMHAACAQNSYAVKRLVAAGADASKVTNAHKTVINLIEQQSNSNSSDMVKLINAPQKKKQDRPKQPKVKLSSIGVMSKKLEREAKLTRNRLAQLFQSELRLLKLTKSLEEESNKNSAQAKLIQNQLNALKKKRAFSEDLDLSTLTDAEIDDIKKRCFILPACELKQRLEHECSLRHQYTLSDVDSLAKKKLDGVLQVNESEHDVTLPAHSKEIEHELLPILRKLEMQREELAKKGAQLLQREQKMNHEFVLAQDNLNTFDNVAINSQKNFKLLSKDEFDTIIKTDFFKVPESHYKKFLRRQYYLRNEGALLDNGPFNKNFSVQELYDAHCITTEDIKTGISDGSKCIKLDLSNKNIDSLEGLDKLRLCNNVVGCLDLSKNNLTTLTSRDITILKSMKRLKILLVQENKLQSIAENIKELSHLKIIDISNNQLTTLPEGLCELTNLVYIRMNNNGIKELPSCIGNLKQLKILRAESNCLTALPSDIGALDNLKELALSNNFLTRLPNSIGFLSNLLKLFINNNALTELPDTLQFLSALEELQAENNGITALPEGLGKLSCLKKINIHKNRLTYIPETVSKLVELTVLDISGNMITRALPDLSALKNLQVLGLSEVSLTAVPEWIWSLHCLRILALEKNEINHLSESLGNLVNLQMLILQHNKLQQLPASLGKLTALKKLNVHHNELSSLPENIEELKELTTLEITHNKLKELPNSVGKLSKLRELKLSHNELTQIPQEVGNLQNLELLNIAFNDIENLPQELAKLKALQTLLVYGNKLNHVPAVVSELPSLTNLSLGENSITQIPDTLGTLTQLEILSLERNKLTFYPHVLNKLRLLKLLTLAHNPMKDFPLAMHELDKLETLALDNMQLNELPISICGMSNIRNLYLAHNELEFLPSSINDLQSLQCLDVSHNRLRELPETLTRMPALMSLNVSNNQLTTLAHIPSLYRLYAIHNRLTLPLPYYHKSILEVLEDTPQMQ